MVKPRLWSDSGESSDHAKYRLVEALSVFLRLLHPVMPFLTEALWDKLRPLALQAGMDIAEPPIIRAQWPDKDMFSKDDESCRITDIARNIATAINNVRAEHEAIGEHVKLPSVLLTAPDMSDLNALSPYFPGLERFVKAENIKADAGVSRPPQSAAGVVGDMEIFIPLAGLIDLDAEKQRLNKKINQFQIDLDKVMKKLDNPSFLEKAPPAIIEKERSKQSEIETTLEKLKQNLNLME